METQCQKHSERDSVATCRYCGRNLCSDCSLQVNGLFLSRCKDQDDCLQYQAADFTRQETKVQQTEVTSAHVKIQHQIWPRWYTYYSSILRVVSYILMIPIAASVMETLASYSKIYTSPYPWPIWFKVVALLIAIPAGIIIETINKLDTIRNHLEILQSGNPQIRRMSAESLRQYESHSKYTIPALIEALNDKEETVVKEATESLKKLSGKDLGQDQEKWLEWWTEKQG